MKFKVIENISEFKDIDHSNKMTCIYIIISHFPYFLYEIKNKLLSNNLISLAKKLLG